MDELIIDIRQIGKIDYLSEKWLNDLIISSCGNNGIKYYLSNAAKDDFGWSAGNLIVYVLAGYMDMVSTRTREFISSSEWLNGIFASGSLLVYDHIYLIMSFINPASNISKTGVEYISGKSYWEKAPTALKNLLDILDDAAINKLDVKVICPIVTPISSEHTPDYIEKLTPDEMLPLITIRWE